MWAGKLVSDYQSFYQPSASLLNIFFNQKWITKIQMHCKPKSVGTILIKNTLLLRIKGWQNYSKYFKSKEDWSGWI